MLGKKAILAGDHKQLEPTIKSEKAAKDGLSNTVFERLMKTLPAGCSVMLTVQYRMNSQIMGWSSSSFYHSKLEAAPLVASHRLEYSPPEWDD